MVKYSHRFRRAWNSFQDRLGDQDGKSTIDKLRGLLGSQSSHDYDAEVPTRTVWKMTPNFKVHFDENSNEIVSARHRSKTYFMLGLSDVDQSTIASSAAFRAAGGVMPINLWVLHEITARASRDGGQQHLNEVRQVWDGHLPTTPPTYYTVATISSITTCCR